jgi:asparagine synthetase B (glutamine-hydrolysing)
MAQRIGKGRLAGIGLVSAEQYYSFKTDLAGYILVCMGDRAEMAHSVEGRTPFLDHKLVEFACSLPRDLKLRNNTGKYILRQAMAPTMPAAPDILKRPLMAPSAETLGLDRGSEFLAPFLEPRMVKDAGVFDPIAVRALRLGVRFLPRGSYGHSLAESVLTVVASTHALHHLYCEKFEQSAARFSVSPTELKLAEGAKVG